MISNLFVKIFVHNEIYRYRCYLFNIWILIRARYTSLGLYLHVRVHIVHTVCENSVIFSWILNTGPHIGGSRQIQLWDHQEWGDGGRRGAGNRASLRPPGASNSSAGTGDGRPWCRPSRISIEILDLATPCTSTTRWNCSICLSIQGESKKVDPLRVSSIFSLGLSLFA